MTDLFLSVEVCVNMSIQVVTAEQRQNTGGALTVAKWLIQPTVSAHSNRNKAITKLVQSANANVHFTDANKLKSDRIKRFIRQNLYLV